MLSFSLESAKYIKQQTKDTVSGYLRQIQLLLPYKQNSFYIIPELIKTIITIFYNGECFATAGDRIELNHQNINFKSYNHKKSVTAYGNMNITNDCTYIWRFKLNHIVDNWGMMAIGIASKNKHLNDSFSDMRRSYAIQFYKGNYNWNQVRCEGDDPVDIKWKHHGYHCRGRHVFKKDDVISMTLNMEHCTLIYHINGRKYDAWFENIKLYKDTVYSMAISFTDGEYNISLIDYQVFPIIQ